MNTTATDIHMRLLGYALKRGTGTPFISLNPNFHTYYHFILFVLSYHGAPPSMLSTGFSNVFG
jgi:hypothetical protein